MSSLISGWFGGQKDGADDDDKDEFPTTPEENIEASLAGTFRLRNPETRIYETRAENCRMIIAKTNTKYETDIRVISDGRTFFSTSLDKDMMFEKTEDLIIGVIPLGGILQLMQFQYDDVDAAQKFWIEVSRKKYEYSLKSEFDKQVKAKDRDWVYAGNDAYMYEASDDEDEEDGYDDKIHYEEDDDVLVYAEKGWKSKMGEEDDDGEAHNTEYDAAITNNRSFVVRGGRVAVFETGEEQMSYLGRIPRLKGLDGVEFEPSKAMLSDSDQRMLLLNPSKPNTVHSLDLTTGKVVEEYNAGERELCSINQQTKYAQRTDDKLFMGVTQNATFAFDKRIAPNRNQIVNEMSYKSRPKLNCAVTTEDGSIAVGSDKGEIRFFDRLGIRAKTLLPGFGDPILAMDTTNDGQWVICTTNTYIMVIPTKMPDSDRTGFKVRMGKDKPKPILLRLKNDDIVDYGMDPVKFKAAYFNTGDNIDEEWLATSTGEYVITWNFSKIKRCKGTVREHYQITKSSDTVVSDRFRFNRGDEMVINLHNDVALRPRRH